MVRYGLVCIVDVVGVVQFNLVVGLVLAAGSYLGAPYLAHPFDALRYLRRRSAQRRHETALNAGFGDFVDIGGSSGQVGRAMSGQIKLFRAFTSSTFGDLSDERDLLAKEVFPRIERRGAVWAPIDLRWGITELTLQQDAGGVVRICLDSVERSSPNTIGIVGSRYGARLPLTARDTMSSGCFWDLGVSAALA